VEVVVAGSESSLSGLREVGTGTTDSGQHPMLPREVSDELSPCGIDSFNVAGRACEEYEKRSLAARVFFH
jgi:hypothetical protein